MGDGEGTERVWGGRKIAKCEIVFKKRVLGVVCSSWEVRILISIKES